jgi:hypothetical protein
LLHGVQIFDNSLNFWFVDVLELVVLVFGERRHTSWRRAMNQGVWVRTVNVNRYVFARPGAKVRNAQWAMPFLLGLTERLNYPSIAVDPLQTSVVKLHPIFVNGPTVQLSFTNELCVKDEIVVS